jgi:tetratricopeptide (TPR) repeat protein
MIVALEDTPRDRQIVARSVQRVGAVAERAGDRTGALAAFSRSAQLLAELTVHDPANATWKRDHAEAIERIGETERALGHAAESAAAFRKSQEMRRALVELDPKNLTWLRELATSYDSLAQIEFDLGKLDDAEKLYRTGLGLVEKLVALEPANTLIRNDLYGNLGQLARLMHARGDLDAALQLFERRLATANELVATAPSNQHEFRVSNAHEDMSIILMDRGDAPAARAHAKQSLAIRERLVAASPGHVQWTSALATSIEAIAQAQDKPADARPLIAKSIGYRRTLLAKDPADIVLRVDLLLGLMIEARVTRDLADHAAATASQTEALGIAKALVAADPASSLFALYLEQSLEIGGDLAAAQQRDADAAQQYRAAIAALEPYVDAALTDSHLAGEVAEARWKLSRVVTGTERASLVRAARATFEQLKRTKRLAPDRAKLLATIVASRA